MAIAQHLPCLGVLLAVSGQRGGPYASYRSTHRSTLSSQASDLSWISGQKRQASLGSESEVVRMRWSPKDSTWSYFPQPRQPQGSETEGPSGPWDAGRKSPSQLPHGLPLPHPP